MLGYDDFMLGMILAAPMEKVKVSFPHLALYFGPPALYRGALGVVPSLPSEPESGYDNSRCRKPAVSISRWALAPGQVPVSRTGPNASACRLMFSDQAYHRAPP